MLSRTALLFGAEKLAALQGARAIVFGVGGVGSWCAEALVRTGIGHVTLVDADIVDISNLNRQLPATTLTIGQPKALVLADRLRSIMPGASIDAIQAFYDEASAADFRLQDYDVVIDAIDSVAAKAHLILHATSLPGVKLFSSMGAAQRSDPSRVEVAEFWKVKGCPLARALRDRFKRNATMPRRKFKCVYSTEAPHGEPKGTSMAVTATFGLRLAALAIDYITERINQQETTI